MAVKRTKHKTNTWSTNNNIQYCKTQSA